MKYVKKPIPVEARQIPNWDDSKDFVEWLNGIDPKRIVELRSHNGVLTLRIRTLEGIMDAKAGDYLIKGGDDEFWFNKKEIFEERYEEWSDDFDILLTPEELDDQNN